VLGFLGGGREESAESDVIGPGLTRAHRQMAAVVAGDADLRVRPEAVAGFARVAIILPQVDAIGVEALGEADRIVDDKGHLTLGADRLKRGGQSGGGMLVQPFDAELEGGDAMLVLHARLDHAAQALGEITRHIEGRDQIDLGARAQLRIDLVAEGGFVGQDARSKGFSKSSSKVSSAMAAL
jgi:hypothetical protein